MLSLPPRLEYYSAADGQRLLARVWDADQTPIARIVFLHGITSHSGWYSQSCEHLRRAGYEVHFLDRRGSGMNPDGRGDVDRWQTWISDVSTYLNLLDRSRPLVVAGISWGGKLAVAVARQHAGLVRALALICPGIYSPHEPGFLKRLLLAAPKPDGLRRRQAAIPLRYASLFTNTAAWRSFIDRDPLALRQITVQFAEEDRKLTRYARASAPFLRMPLFLALAGHDRIVDNRRMRTFFTRTASSDKMLVEYTHAAHTLEFELDPSHFLADLTNWLGVQIRLGENSINAT